MLDGMSKLQKKKRGGVDAIGSTGQVDPHPSWERVGWVQVQDEGGPIGADRLPTVRQGKL